MQNPKFKYALIGSVCLLTLVFLRLFLVRTNLTDIGQNFKQIELPNGEHPKKLSSTENDNNFIVLTDSGALLLYSSDGRLLDSRNENDIKDVFYDQKYGIIGYINGKMEIISRKWTLIGDGLKYKTFTIQDDHIVTTKNNIDAKWNRPQDDSAQFKSSNIKFWGKCLSIDIEYGSCFYHDISFIFNGKYVVLYDKFPASAVKLTGGNSAVIFRPYEIKAKLPSNQLFITSKK